MLNPFGWLSIIEGKAWLPAIAGAGHWIMTFEANQAKITVSAFCVSDLSDLFFRTAMSPIESIVEV